MWAVLIPFPSKRGVAGSLFCALMRRKFSLRLSMISWGQFYVTERFCDLLIRHNLLIKLQPWLTFLWTTFCPCLSIYLSIIHLHILLSIYSTSIHLYSINFHVAYSYFQVFHTTFSADLSNYLLIYLLIFLVIYLSINDLFLYLSIFLSNKHLFYIYLNVF